MRSRTKGHAAVGGVTAALGVCAALLGVVRPAWALGTFLATPVWALLLTVGFVLLLAGGCTIVFSFRPLPAEADVVPAHVAFNSRMNAPSIVPSGFASPAPMMANGERASSRLDLPAAPTQKRVAPGRTDLADIDVQIRELTRQIGKAGVMLATGQLSQQGYLAYVDDLKRRRGNLEAARVKAELRS